MDQAAALLFRILPGVANIAGEAVDVLLVTSRDTGRWVLPKGNIDVGESAADAAAREALEEAGASGLIFPDPIGSYSYAKREHGGGARQVAVYPMRVRDLAADWPERKQRERQWFSRAKAAQLVEESGLAALIAGFRG